MLINLLDRIIADSKPGSLALMLKAAPRGVLDKKKELSFRATVRYAYKNSPFYKKKFDSLGIDPASIRRPEDLGDFFTTTQDIIDNAEQFLCRAPHVVFESSGTTGKNKRVYFTQDELTHIGKMNAAGMILGGITKDDRLVNAFDFAIWIPGMVTQRGLDHLGALHIIAGKVDPVEIYRRIPTYGINVVLGEPTWLIKLTELARNDKSYPMKMFIAGGEDMPEAAKPWMKKVWQGVDVRMVYASVESGGIMAFEPFGECGDYHINENDFYMEISNPGPDGYGEVVFTTLSRFTMPLIRYKNRDVSKIIDTPCSCGLPVRKLAKMRGRTDEMVITAAGNLYPLMFENIFKTIDGITLDWQVVFKLRGIKEVMEINLELKDTSAKDDIKDKVLSRIKDLYPDIWKNLEIGIFDMDFVFRQAGDLRKSRKLIRIIDKRYER